MAEPPNYFTIYFNCEKINEVREVESIKKEIELAQKKVEFISEKIKISRLEITQLSKKIDQIKLEKSEVNSALRFLVSTTPHLSELERELYINEVWAKSTQEMFKIQEREKSEKVTKNPEILRRIVESKAIEKQLLILNKRREREESFSRLSNKKISKNAKLPETPKEWEDYRETLKIKKLDQELISLKMKADPLLEQVQENVLIERKVQINLELNKMIGNFYKSSLKNDPLRIKLNQFKEKKNIINNKIDDCRKIGILESQRLELKEEIDRLKRSQIKEKIALEEHIKGQRRAVRAHQRALKKLQAKK